MTFNSAPLDRCAICGNFLLPDDVFCPNCGQKTDDTQDIETLPFTSAETLPHWPAEAPGNSSFPAHYGLMLQVLPSGNCLSHPLPATLLLGRSLDSSLEDALDLTGLRAKAHGVSRHHCLFQRSGATLKVIDLGSTNGTILNNVQLTPHTPYLVANNDHIVLGTLHLIVSFARLSTP